MPIIFTSYLAILDIEQKRQRRAHYLWYRVSDAQYLNRSASLSPPLRQQRSIATSNTRRESVTPRPPSLRTTPPSEDASYTPISPSSQKHSPTKSNHSQANERVSKLSNCISNTKKIPNPLKPVLRPRTFHLSRGSASSTPQTMVTINGVQKTKRRRQDLACFVETRKMSSKLKSSCNLSIVPNIVLNRAEGDSQPTKNGSGPSPRKRPIVNDVEKKWRNENWTRSTSKDKVTPNLPQVPLKETTSTGQFDYQSSALIEKLHKVALEETASLFRSGVQYSNQREPKINPKPSKARRQDNQSAMNDDEPVKTIQIYDSEDDFVYDTFVRTCNQSTILDSSMPDINALDMVDGHKIGILIITEEDQLEWEKFGEDEESDKDWNSEEEDENGEFQSADRKISCMLLTISAEDFYGNDYPEDEVDSDDEYGRGAYNFRKYGSDNEEYDEDSTTWSDEDCDGRNHWKSNN